MPPWEKYASTTPQAAPGGPWAKYAASPTPEPQAAPQGTSDALANAFGQGSTFNFGDELTAYIRTVAPGFSNWMMSKGPLQRDESIGGPGPAAQTVATGPNAYEDELAKIRAQTKADETANPNLMLAANVAGNVAGTVPLLAAAPAALTSVSPSILVNAAKLATTGAALGGTAGFGAGEGGIENRAANAVIPAVAGGVLGGATPFAGSLLRSVAESTPGRAVSRNVVDPIARYLMRSGGNELGGRAESVVQSGAMQRLASAAQRGRFNPAQGQTVLDDLGTQAMVADINPALRGQAELANTMPGQTQTRAEQVLTARAGGAPQRMTRALEGSQPPPSAYALRGKGQAFDQNIRAVGQGAYQGDMIEAGLRQSPELRAMLDNPQIAPAIEQVLSIDKATRVGRPNAPPLTPVEVMHRVKQMVEQQGFREGTAIPGPNMQSYRDVATDFTSTLKRDNPALAEADRLYSQAKSLPEFFDAGANALRPASMTEAGIERSAPAIADLLQGANPQQALAARTGLINAARTQVQEGTPQTLALARKLTGDSRPLQQQFETLAPDVAPNVVRQARAETTFADTAKAVREGSPTARRLAQMADEGGGPQIRVDPRGITTRAIEKVGDILRNVQAPNEAVRDEIGRLLLNPDAPQNRELLQRLAIALQQRQAGTPLRAGAVGATANQLNQVLQ